MAAEQPTEHTHRVKTPTREEILNGSVGNLNAQSKRGK